MALKPRESPNKIESQMYLITNMLMAHISRAAQLAVYTSQPTYASQPAHTERTFWGHTPTTSEVQNLRGLAETRNRIIESAGTGTLDLAGLGLTEIPKNIPATIRTLNLNDNKITEISPDTLPPLLTQLFLGWNRISVIPDDLPPLLDVLYLNNNRITAIPPTLPGKIRGLRLQYNKISIVPDFLPNGLTDFWIDNNPIVEICDALPSSILHLKIGDIEKHIASPSDYGFMGRFMDGESRMDLANRLKKEHIADVSIAAFREILNAQASAKRITMRCYVIRDELALH